MPFLSHIELLQFFLGRRGEIVERIQSVLNAQRRPPEYLQNAALLSDLFEDCFFTLTGTSASHLRLRGQLEDAHRASGFEPRELPGLHNGLVDPAEMMVRAFHLWQQTRWPGRSGRVHYAHTLFNLSVIRRLEMLSLRLWDAGSAEAPDGLSQVQGVLDRLRAESPAQQPALVRDARWLIPLAQSPATDDLAAYFTVAENVAGSLPEKDRLEIHTAGVLMAAGHLRSQIRYHALKKGVSLDDPGLILNTRNTNALDFALLIQDLVPLLAAYEHALHGNDRRARLELADAICQGVSPDPELFVNRVPLLRAYSMIEHLFIGADPDGHAAYTPTGARHVRLVEEYEERVARVAGPLSDDCSQFRPVAGTYSPYGVLYGFSTDLLEHMALKTVQPDAPTQFSVEDVFSGGATDKLGWVSGWRKLPHLSADVQKQFDYPQQFAEEVFARVERALARRVSDREADDVRNGRLMVAAADPSAAAVSEDSPIQKLPIRYITSTDNRLVASQQAVAVDEASLMSDRREGRCLLSYRTPGGWVAISKAVLTDILGAGQDAQIAGLPPEAASVLKLMCSGLAGRATDESANARSEGTVSQRETKERS